MFFNFLLEIIGFSSSFFEALAGDFKFSLVFLVFYLKLLVFLWFFESFDSIFLLFLSVFAFFT